MGANYFPCTAANFTRRVEAQQRSGIIAKKRFRDVDDIAAAHEHQSRLPDLAVNNLTRGAKRGIDFLKSLAATRPPDDELNFSVTVDDASDSLAMQVRHAHDFLRDVND